MTLVGRDGPSIPSNQVSGLDFLEQVPLVTVSSLCHGKVPVVGDVTSECDLRSTTGGLEEKD